MTRYLLLPVCLVICGCAGRIPVESVEKSKTASVSTVLPLTEPSVFLLDVTDPVTGEIRTIGISKAGTGTFSEKGTVSVPVSFLFDGTVLKTEEKTIGTEISVSGVVWANERGYIKLSVSSLRVEGEVERDIGGKKIKAPLFREGACSFNGPVICNEWNLIGGVYQSNGGTREVRIRLRRP